MKIELVTHETGEQIPMMLDDSGMPVVLPNEFILARRSLSTNTLVRNLRELSVLYRWLDKSNYDLSAKLLAQNSFNEAELKGGLVEALRIDQANGRINLVAPNTFNQRLTTIRQFISWCMDVLISQLPLSSLDYERLRERKSFFLKMLEGSFMSGTPMKKSLRKGLNEVEVDFLLAVLHPDAKQGFGRDLAVKFRNYVSVGLMLFCGLRPGELLSLRVEDVQVGAISAIKIERRPADSMDVRRPRPQIKRNGRLIPIESRQFAFALNEYIVTWRDVLESKSNHESDYLILSDEGAPLSQSSITQFFQEVQDAILKAGIQAVHDVGTGICVHNFSQTPCERHLQCSADCKDYVWAKDDKGRLDEQKRQYALTALARKNAEKQLDSTKPKKSADWLAHNDKKLKTLASQLAANGVEHFDPEQYLHEVEHG